MSVIPDFKYKFELKINLYILLIGISFAVIQAYIDSLF